MSKFKTKALRDLAHHEGRIRTWMGSKGEAAEHFRAQKNKKKLPTFERKYKPKDLEFRNLSMSEYKKKYPDTIFSKYL